MEKKYLYIFWDGDDVLEKERRLYIQCMECYKKNGKGFPWSSHLLQKNINVKCDLCYTIIYQNKKGENEASI